MLPNSWESRRGFDVLRNEFGFALETVIPVAYTFEGNPFSKTNLAIAYDVGHELERLDGVTDVSSIVTLGTTFGPEQYELLYQHPES